MKNHIFNISLFILAFCCFQACSSVAANSTSVQQTSMEFDQYLQAQQDSDSLLVDIQAKIEQKFIQSIASDDLTAINEMANTLAELDKKQPNNLIKYWQAYTAYKQSICYIKMGDKNNSKKAIENGIDLFDEMSSVNSEDYALKGLMLSFSIQFRSGLGAASVSSKVKKNAEKALELNDKNLRAYYVLGSNDFYTPEKYGGGKEAEKLLTQAIESPLQTIDSNYFPSWGKDSAYELLIKFYIRKGDTEKAKGIFKKAIQEYPDNYMINQLAKKLI